MRASGAGLWISGRRAKSKLTMSKQEKANIWLGKLARSYIMWSYRRQVCSRRRANPELYPPCSPEVESRHRALWSSLHKNASCEWLRFFSHASGLEDFRYVPEDIYYGIIEPIFNDTNYSWVIADKNFYDMRFDATLFPETVLRNVAGDFLDHDFNLLTPAQARSLLESQHRDLVIKPSLDSGGGKNVAIIRYRDGKHFAKDGGGISFDGILNKWGGG